MDIPPLRGSDQYLVAVVNRFDSIGLLLCFLQEPFTLLVTERVGIGEVDSDAFQKLKLYMEFSVIFLGLF